MGSGERGISWRNAPQRLALFLNRFDHVSQLQPSVTVSHIQRFQNTQQMPPSLLAISPLDELGRVAEDLVDNLLGFRLAACLVGRTQWSGTRSSMRTPVA